MSTEDKLREVMSNLLEIIDNHQRTLRSIGQGLESIHDYGNDITRNEYEEYLEFEKYSEKNELMIESVRKLLDKSVKKI